MDLLVEKYRPKELKDVLGNSDTLETLNLILEEGNLPHLLFTGPPGTGKTTCAKIIARKLLINKLKSENNNFKLEENMENIKKKYKECVLELNASDDRGIDVIRDKIKSFALKRIGSQNNGNNFAVKKIIILDEADSMTTAAQQALRRVMETCGDTRFVLICNTFSKIFEPVQSRCAVLKFDRLVFGDISKYLLKISEKEGINVDKTAIETIVTLSDGDMRQALNILQSCSFIHNNKIKNVSRIDEKTILKITGQPNPKLIAAIIDNLMNKNINEAVDIFNKIWNERFDAVDIIQGFFRIAKNLDSYELLRCIGPAHLRIVDGIDTKLQFYGMFSDMLNITEH
jgi:replication factor C subunit 2/4